MSDRNRLVFVTALIGSTIVLSSLYFYFSNLEILILLLIALSIFVFIIFYKSAKWISRLGPITKTYAIILGIGCLIFIGSAAISRIVQYTPGADTLITIAYSFETFGVMLIAFGAWKSPNLSELEWKEKLLGLYIITSTGICIFKHSFKQIETMDPLLVGGGITSVVKMVKEMTKSNQRLSHIKQTDRNILFEYGKYVTVALLVEEDLEILKYKLKFLLLNFEEFFRDVLPTWNGNLDLFKPAKVLVEKIFT
ncbi:MAG: hypothetical protein ACTSRG_16180 [Candidatus Helarchaeota archaeon]